MLLLSLSSRWMWTLRFSPATRDTRGQLRAIWAYRGITWFEVLAGANAYQRAIGTRDFWMR